MGFFSGVKNVGGYVFNFRVDKWVDYNQLKTTTTKILGIGAEVFRPEQADRTETFEHALERLNLTEVELNTRKTEFIRLMIIYSLVATLIFVYSLWIAVANKNIMGFFMGFCITIYALTHAFRYHFWIYQIKHRKLGCSVREWFSDQR